MAARSRLRPEPAPRSRLLREARRADEQHARALRAIADFGFWIQNADTKAGLLGVLLGALVAALISQAGLVQQVATRAGARAWPAWALLACHLVALGGAFAELVRSQLPRLRPSGESAYAFPWVAGQDLDTLTAAGRAATGRSAWQHARLLARIASEKFRYLRRALWWTAAALPLFVAWSLAAALLAR